MELKKITLDSMFTPYTLDTYQTFDLSDETDQIMQDINDNNPGKNIEEQDVYFTFKNQEYLQALANARLNLLKSNILDNVIININSDGAPTSPREYNYKTDNAFNVFTVNATALDQYISDHQTDYDKNHIKDAPGFWWFGDDDQTKLNYYLFNESVKKYDFIESYYYNMIEAVPGYDYIDFTTPIERLEYLRQELRAERISYGELAELQALAKYIDPNDIELLEAAGVPEKL